MNFDLGAVLSALITGGLAAVVALATSLSPSNVRVKRLEKLVDARERVDSAAARRRLDYSIESLTYQIAEDARLLGNRSRRTAIVGGILTMSIGLGQLVYMMATGQTGRVSGLVVGFGGLVLGIVAVLLGTTWMEQADEDRVREDLSESPPE